MGAGRRCETPRVRSRGPNHSQQSQRPEHPHLHQLTRPWFLQGAAQAAGAGRGRLFRRAAWSLRSADLLSWAVSLLISALEGGNREGGILSNTLDCSQACPMLQGVTVSVFQSHRKILQDPLDLTGYRRQAGLRFCPLAPLVSPVSRVRRGAPFSVCVELT